MQAYILAFFAVDVNGDALRQTQGLAIGGFDVLQIGSRNRSTARRRRRIAAADCQHVTAADCQCAG